MLQKLYHKFSSMITTFFFLTLFLTFFIWGFIVTQRPDYRLTSFPNQAFTLDQGWSYWIDQEPQPDLVTLPLDLPSGRGEIHLSRTLSAQDFTFDQTPSLLLFSKYMNFRVYLDDQLIKSYTAPEDGYTTSTGSIYMLIPLPDDWENKTLTIYGVTLLDDNIAFTFIPPILAPAGDILHHVIVDELFAIISDFIMIVLGLLLLACSVAFGYINQRALRNQTLYTGLFSLFFAFYDLALTTTIHLLIQNTYFLYLMEFFSLMMVSIPLLMLAREWGTGKVSYWINFALLIILSNFFLQVLFHFFFGREVRQMLIFTHISLAISFTLTVIVLFSRSKSVSQRQFAISLLPLLFGGVVDIIRFYLQWTQSINLMFRLGTLIFICAQIFFVFTAYFSLYKRSVEATYLERLAYWDVLTQLGNRAAFERDTQQALPTLSANLPFWCISIDVNGLKLINDSQGHLVGDQLIRKAAAAISIAFTGLGQAYRVGGDEFLILVFGSEEPTIATALLHLEQELERQNQTTPTVSIAVGYSRYQEEDALDLDKLLARADSAMYQNKETLRQGSVQSYSQL